MEMNSNCEETVASGDNYDKSVNELRDVAMLGDWFEVTRMFMEKGELRTAKITPTGDTVLHVAASKGLTRPVRIMVSCLLEEDKPSAAAAEETGNEKEYVLGAKNDKYNTPLHLAASASWGSFEMCRVLGEAYPSVITQSNSSGETPLFMAALNGNKEAFLWLHYNIPKEGPSTHHINQNKDTILHCAIAGAHIDVAIEIVYLYENHLEEMAMMPNKNGLFPIHLLAIKPSAFKSTVKEKKQAMTEQELLAQHERIYIGRRWMDHIDDWLYSCYKNVYEWCEGSCLRVISPFYVALLWFLRGLIWFLLIPLYGLSYLFWRTEIWFNGIRRLKEKHTWSRQIIKRLVRFASSEDQTANLEDIGSHIIVDPPLMIAAQNGVIEIVEFLLERISSAAEVVNEKGKNIVLLAAEKRQTKLYQFLWDKRYLFDSETAFSTVDKDGNTAWHLAAMVGMNQDIQTTTMIEELKWFEFVKNSVPSELREKYNNDGKTAEDIFRKSYKEHLTNDKKWFDKTSQTCSVASTVVASMAFSNFAGENINTKNDSSLVALSLSLTSTISFLAIPAFRSQSLNFWRYGPFMLHLAILSMIGSIVALWISLTFHGKSLTTYIIVGSPIFILSIISLPIFIGPTLMFMFAKVLPSNLGTSTAFRYRLPQKEEHRTDFDRNQKSTPYHTSRANDSL